MKLSGIRKAVLKAANKVAIPKLGLRQLELNGDYYLVFDRDPVTLPDDSKHNPEVNEVNET